MDRSIVQIAGSLGRDNSKDILKFANDTKLNSKKSEDKIDIYIYLDYVVAKYYFRNKKYYKAIKKLNKSLSKNYNYNYTGISKRFIMLSKWLLGECYYNINCLKTSKKIFKDLSKIYKYEKDIDFRMITLFNYVRCCKNNIYHLSNIIRKYEKIFYSTSRNDIEVELFKNNIYAMYLDLSKICIKTNDEFSLRLNINKIKDINIKHEIIKDIRGYHYEKNDCNVNIVSCNFNSSNAL